MCFWHLMRKLHGCLPLEVVQVHYTVKRLRGKPGIHWKDYILFLARVHLIVSQKEQGNLASKVISGFSL